MIKPDIERYKEERQKWIEEGQPVRSPERVEEIFNNYCKPCPKFIPIPLFSNRGQCGKCSCLLSSDSDKMNKIQWATTRCPLTIEEDGQEPKWIEEPQQIEAAQVVEQPRIGPDPYRNRKGGGGGGCNCP
jgi:hypothetical protein